VLDERIGAVLDELTAVDLAGVADPLDIARRARAAESRLSAFGLSALAEAERQGAARTAGALADPDHSKTREGLASGRFGWSRPTS
jgi:hypothetical protein